MGSLDFTFAARRLLLLLLRLLRFLLLLRVLALPFHRLYPEPAGATSFCGPEPLEGIFLFKNIPEPHPSVDLGAIFK